MRDRNLGIAIAAVGLAMVIGTAMAARGFLLEQHSLSVAGLGFTIVGALIVYKTGHRVGWVTAATGFLLVANGLLSELPASPLMDRFLFIAWTSSIFAAGLLVFWFPTGRPVSPRWEWTMWVAVTAHVIGTVIVGEGSWVSAAHGATFTIVGGFVVVTVASLVVRYLRSTRIVRQQIKWFTFAVFGVAFLNLIWDLAGDRAPVPPIIWDLALAIALLAVPVSIGVAILRFHLYEIDRLVSRTVTYLIVIGTLALLFVAVTWLPWILVIGVGAGGSTPPPVIAGATLTAAALFNPLRKRVQHRVERRFNRSHYDATAVAERFGDELRDSHEVDEIIDGLITVVSRTLSPSALGAWTRTGKN